MNKGKNICNQLKAVRKSIAEENGIPLEIKECTYKGECKGTCPRCEAEVRYLEAELEKRVRLGKVATVAGLAMTLAACGTGVPNTPVDTNADMLEGEVAFELMEDDTIPPPPPPDTPGIQLSGIIEDEGFVIDTNVTSPREGWSKTGVGEPLKHLPDAAEPLPEEWYDKYGTASCNPLDEPRVILRGESGTVWSTGTVMRRRRTKVLVPQTPQEARAEAERKDARRALPPVVNYDEVDGVKIINNDE